MRYLMAVVLIGLACSDKTPPHDHSSAHASDHDHHAEGHGHGDVDMVSLTLWSERFEVFAEHPAAVVGKKLPFLVHVTELDGFRSVKQGVLALELDGPAAVRGHAFQPIRPGILS